MMTMTSNNNTNYHIHKQTNNHTPYEEIKVTLKLKKNIAFVGRLISYQQNKTFDSFVSEEIRHLAILFFNLNLYLNYY
jgi:hypothetical protein